MRRSLVIVVPLTLALAPGPGWAAPSDAGRKTPAPATRSPRPPAPAPAPTIPPAPPPAPTPPSAPAPPPATAAPATGVSQRPGLAARPQAAITRFAVSGDDPSPALAMQLQDGFTLGLVRAGIPVLDPLDVARTLRDSPELERCESSPCLKRVGHMLEVRHVLQVDVKIEGNSYKMTARVFSTEGAAPAALPVKNQSRFCNVCTADEARDVMIRLAEDVKGPLEHAQLTGGAPPPSAPRRVWPWFAVTGGALAALAGILTISSAPKDGKDSAAVGGVLVGAGLSAAALGLYVGLDTRRGGATVAVAARF